MGSTDLSPEAEFTAFVTEAGPRLHRTARLLCGDAHRAEELVQQTLVKTHLAWPRAQATDPEAYARRILANQRIDTWRKHRRERLTDPADLPDAPVPSPAADAADRDEVVRALLTLTPRQRRIVVLRYLVGLTDAEVAADLGVAVGTVKSTTSRALAQLRELLLPAGAVDGRAGEADAPTPDDAVAARLHTGADAGSDLAAPRTDAGAAIRRATRVRRNRRVLAAAGVAGAAVIALVVGDVLLRSPEPPPAATADYNVWFSVEEMAASAGAVVEGIVLDERREDIDLSDGEPIDRFLVHRFEVTADVLGTTTPGDVLEIQVGATPNATDTGPLLQVGTRYVLFLSEPYPDGVPRSMLNPSQAAYRVEPDGSFTDITPDDDGLALELTQADLDAIRASVS